MPRGKKPNNGGVPWKRNSKDGQKLKKLLLSGSISKGCPPCVIIEEQLEFQKYIPESFCSALHHLKQDIGFNLHDNGKSIFYTD